MPATPPRTPTGTDIKAIVFDADGVVISRPYLFSEYLERTHGLTRQDTAPFFTGVFLDCLVGRADLKVEIAPYLRTWGWPGSVEAFLHTWFEAENAPDASLIDAIQQLRQRGMGCHLGTNQERYRVEYMQSVMGFSALFDSVHSSASLGALKPETAFYARLTARLQLVPAHILFFDDTPKNVEAARAFGWHAEHYVGRAGFEDALSAYGLQD